MRPAALVAIVFLTLVALIHLLRLILRVEVAIGDALLPFWVSWLAVVGPAALAIWLWREQRGRPVRPAP